MMTMTKTELLLALSEAYGDGELELQYDLETDQGLSEWVNPPPWPGVWGARTIPCGDTLATYIVTELDDLWQPDSLTDTLDSLELAMRTARSDIQQVLCKIEELRDEAYMALEDNEPV